MADKFHHEAIYRGADELAKLAGQHLTICGAGALGSHLADNLARQGVRHLRVIDRDRVEEHNVSTQLYGESDVGDGFRGGEFLFCDVPEGPGARRRQVRAGLGDAVLFCTRDRLVPIGGVYGLQPVKHGVAEITAGTRVVLGVPFHEYR